MQTSYLSGVTNPALEHEARRGLNVGLLITPRTHTESKLDHFASWAADNGCFAQGASFDAETWLDWLGRDDLRERRRTCRFAVAPDVVGNARATLKRSLPYLDAIRQLGYRAAFVAQDGCDRARMIPWDRFDVLFIGGSTEFKLSETAQRVTHEARSRGKRVHMGRVNSRKRMDVARSWGCSSVDGTFLAFGPDVNLQRLKSWL